MNDELEALRNENDAPDFDATREQLIAYIKRIEQAAITARHERDDMLKLAGSLSEHLARRDTVRVWWSGSAA